MSEVGAPPSSAPSYEQARAELAEVVRALEAGGTTLEEALRLWERGEQLARICQEWLDGARRRLDAAIAADRAGTADRAHTAGRIDTTDTAHATEPGAPPAPPAADGR